MHDGIPAVYARVWRFAYSLSGTRSGADDLAQATVQRALEKADGFTPGTHLDRWLFVIARRLFLNDRRRDLRLVAGDDATSTELPSADLPAEMNILARQVFDHVMALPSKQRATVLLVYVEGYTYAEAADLLEIPVGTVMSRLSVARRTITAKCQDVNDQERKAGRA